MRPDILFLLNDEENNTDLLQEYFIPFNHFVPFVDRLRTIIKEEHVNLLNISVRYVKKSNEALLSYAKEDEIALALYINQKLTKQAQEKLKHATQRIVDLTYKEGGVYYLPYQPYPTKEQMRKIYPKAEKFFVKKKEYDPKLRFLNKFYEDYSNDK